jgi:hypothetical protein
MTFSRLPPRGRDCLGTGQPWSRQATTRMRRGSFERRPVRCIAGAGVPFVTVTFVRKYERSHANLGKGKYDTRAPYNASIAAVAAG